MTIVDICNIALIRLGAEKIVTLDDDTKRAGLCKVLYSVVKDEMIQSHPWRFARKRKRSVGAAVSSNVFGWAYKHTLPADFRRMFMAEDQDENWTIESGILYTDTQNLNYVYVLTVDEIALPSYFVLALASRLAQEMAYSMIQSTELQAAIEAEHSRKLSNARFVDSSGTGSFEYKANDWSTARL